MLDCSGAKLNTLTLHRIGNKSKGEDVIYAKNYFEYDERMESALLKLFLSSFSSENECYCFTHHDDIKFNEVKNYSEHMLEEDDNFINDSKKIATHLYLNGTHPNIRDGELFIARIKGIQLDKKEVHCIGIFKSEIKDSFLTYQEIQAQLDAKLEKGTNIDSLDKGALILFQRNDTSIPPTILVQEKRSVDTNYWIHNFLNIQINSNDAYLTESVMNACLSFTKNKDISQVEKQDLIALNNHFSDYFDSNVEFESSEFFDSVETESLKDEFREYVYEKLNNLDINIDNKFILDNKRVQKISRKIKNIIHLDTGVDIKVTSSQNDISKNLEKGFDKDKNMFYYKVYFNAEIN